MYKCVSCKKVVANLDEKVRCSYCGQRVFSKIRPEVIKRVLAR